ncbi:hypothetical protein B6D52_02960, partial [Candidatus Parcubacteria bacterium 4484_255]
ELVKFLKENLGVKNFINGFRNRKFNIFVDKDIKKKTAYIYEKGKRAIVLTVDALSQILYLYYTEIYL